MSPTKKKTLDLFGVLADGLDASTDGRGWGREHEEARLLANAATELRDVLRATIDGFWHYVEQAHEDGSEAMEVVKDHLALVQAVLKKTELGHWEPMRRAPGPGVRTMDSEQLAEMFVTGDRAKAVAEIARRPEYLATVWTELRDRYGFPQAELDSFARRVKRAGGQS